MKIGDKVEIVNNGKTYSTHVVQAEKFKLRCWTSDTVPDNGLKGILIAIDDNGISAIEADSGHQYLIDIQGLEVVEHSEPTFTQGMCDNKELPPIGSKFRDTEDDAIGVAIAHHGDKVVAHFEDLRGEYFGIKQKNCKPLDVKIVETNEQKLRKLLWDLVQETLHKESDIDSIVSDLMQSNDVEISLK